MSESEEKRQSVLEMSGSEARYFFLKGQSYCNFDLPPYFTFDSLLAKASKQLEGKSLKTMTSCSPRDYDDLSHKILNNKDGKFAWRPLELTHPALYVSLVHKLTEAVNWDILINRFRLFRSNPQIHCLSLPVESRSSQKDKAEQILQWWQEIEQRSIELSLDYEYIAHTDITDCYGSIYTHSVPWALHKRSVMKRPENRNKDSFLGNVIDGHLQDMNHGQTNGISQGSVLMDFIAEIVLGYADFILTVKLRKTPITDYQILRYRDDYRVFTNHPTQGEEILKLISETMYFLGMKLSPGKTILSDDVIRSSIKPDKIEWTGTKQFEKDLQKHLLILHDFAMRHPNSGSLIRALTEFHNRIYRSTKSIRNPSPLIAMVVDIAVNSPKVYSLTAGIVSKLICNLESEEERRTILTQIKRRFEKVPNTGHLQIWLQRITYYHDKSIQFAEPLCKLLDGEEPKLWNNTWLGSKALRNTLSSKKILDKKTLKALEPVIQPKEIELFEAHY